MFRLSRTSVIAWTAAVAVIAALSYALTVVAVPRAAAEGKDKEDKAKKAAPVEFTDGGKLKRPVGYRKWVYVGEVVTPNDMNDGEASFPEFHSVYVDPESFAHYEKTGKYRDGTVIVKELSSVGSKKAPSGDGYFQGEFTGLEAAIKDSKRFKDEPGNWAYFSFGHKYPLKAEVSKNAAAACNQCHQDNAKKDDWVFSQYYPVLRAAASKSK
jgi:Cytochrome P460